jgi:pimeloyl-ACP methyl ester carboxylesterase
MLLFEPFGEHLGTGGGDVPIVLVHGYFQNRVDFIYLARRLRESGSGPLYACNFFWPQKLESSSEFVRSFVEHVREETGAPVVDLLTHSTGGLFALDLLRDEPTVVRRAALIALPAGGVPWRGPLIGTSGRQLRADSSYHAERRMEIDERPVLSIYSAHDNVVHPVETSQLSGSKAVNLEIEGPGHLSVLFDRRVAQAACSFLLAPTDEDALRNARDAVREQRRCGTVYQAHH